MKGGMPWAYAMYDLWWSCSPSHPPQRCVSPWSLYDYEAAQGQAPLAKPDLARAKGESSPYICWHPWVWSPVPGSAGTIGGQWLGRACLPICGAAHVTCGRPGGNSYRCVVGFHGKWLPSRGWLPRARALARVLWHGCVIEAKKGGSQKFLPRRSRILRQVASSKGLGAQRTCPGLCPVAWGAL